MNRVSLNKANICRLHSHIELLNGRITAAVAGSRMKEEKKKIVTTMLTDQLIFIKRAYERGKRMEKRLATYHDAIIDLGFERSK